ncbi:peptidase family M3-domain-containing protein [Xylariaceae sp. FL1019]|nr:peptidase family M3-domain-containing protein [Xylariaceae sp. FL1019]
MEIASRVNHTNLAGALNVVGKAQFIVPAREGYDFACVFNRQDESLHDEVIVLFHELGHAIHDLVSTTTYACLHGPHATPEDFGEAPSQMLEYWRWTQSVLRRPGRHYSYLSAEYLKTWNETHDAGTPRLAEILPYDMIAKLCESSSVFELRQLSVVAFRHDGQSSRESIPDRGLRFVLGMESHSTKAFSLIGMASFDVIHRKSPSKAFANFSHLAGSYGAGYFSISSEFTNPPSPSRAIAY